MSDAEIDINMPDVPPPNEQPEDPLPPSDGVDEMPEMASETAEEEETKVEMKIKEIVPDNEVFKGATDQAPPKRKKRPISEKQREHLAKIRVKALEAKKAKQQANKVPVKSAKKVYEEKIEEEYSDDDTPTPQVDNDSMLYSLTPQQLRQLQMDAIYGYDTIRKDRKQKKKAQQAKEHQEQKAFQAVSRAVNRPVDDDGWGICFQ